MPVISRHLRNVFASGELVREATITKNATDQREGEREVVREIEYYNLDAIISVGYWVNCHPLPSTDHPRVLRDHLTQGYSLDRQGFEKIAAEPGAGLVVESDDRNKKTRCPGDGEYAIGAILLRI